MQSELYKEMAQSILDGDDDEAAALAAQAVEQGVDPLDAINHGFILGVNEVGARYTDGDMFLPDLVLAGETSTEKLTECMGLSCFEKELDFDTVPSSCRIESVSIPMPKKLNIKATCGQRVKMGDLIATRAVPEIDMFDNTVHASIDGRIRDISNNFISIEEG